MRVHRARSIATPAYACTNGLRSKLLVSAKTVFCTLPCARLDTALWGATRAAQAKALASKDGGRQVHLQCQQWP